MYKCILASAREENERKEPQMYNDLRDEQTIIVYNTQPDEGDRCLYDGKVGDMSDEMRSWTRSALTSTAIGAGRT